MQSDLEEGEIPESELPPSASHKEGKLLWSHRVQSVTLLNSRDKKKKESKRYDSPPSEGEYISEEEKFVRRNRILRKDLYKNNLMGKSPKNFYPTHHTYGSVEDIMTKIGESLGRRSNYYCKGRRSKESRYLITINDSRDINSVLRETSPVLKRFGNNYYNKRRYSETNSESVNNIREKYGKIKCKILFDARRSGKDVTKKRKREHSKINEDSKDKTDKFKKVRFFEEKKKETRERNKKQKKHGLDMRLFKEIPLPQEKKPEEKNVKQLAKSEDPNCLLDNPKNSTPHTVAQSNFVDPASTVMLDGESAIRNSTDKPKQINNEDDDDDDVELIKLRLLALTSNKKKSQCLTNDCLDKVKELEIRTEDNAISDSKPDLVDNEKIEENPSPITDETVKERRFDNEIDRYELLLRAEALKTALLKKHQRILKKRKNMSAISGNRQIVGSENHIENKLVKRNEIDVDTISDELLEKNLESDFDAQLGVTENEKRPEIKDVSKSDSESSKEDKTIDNHQEDGLHMENLVTAANTDQSEKSPLPADSNTPESDKSLKNMENILKNAPVGHQMGKKKAKRMKLKQIKKSVDLSETNIKENNVGCEKEDDCQETKSGYSLGFSGKNNVDSEKKFILTDSVTSSNLEVNASSNISNTKLPLNTKLNHKSVIIQKPTTLNNEEPAAKIPENERIIVHLGSDSSDEECVPDCHSEETLHTVANVESKEENPSLVSFASQYNMKEFEKSVELLLKGARRKIESRKELKSEIPATPEAVYSHLAPSQRLEYIRLKQKIAEREKLGKAEKNNLNSSPARERTKSRANSIEDKSIGQINIRKNIEKTPMINQNVRENNKARIYKDDVRTPNYGVFGNIRSARLNQFSTIKKPVPEPNLQKETASTPKKEFTDLNLKNTLKKGPAEIIVERKKMLNQNRLHLERLKILWKNIKLEKMIEAKYEREIKKLKIQQNFFELKINQQRLKIKKLADESKQIYEAFQKNNKKVEVCSKKKRIVAKTENEEKKIKDLDKETTQKDGAIGKESGKDVAKEVISGIVENDVRLIAMDIDMGVNEKREVVKATEEERVDNGMKSDAKEAVAVTDKDGLKEYYSPLQILTKRSEPLDCPRVNPNVIMCQYDLLGKCNDEECVYQHWRA